MFERVHVNRQAEHAFRRRARRAYPAEHIETLWGKVRRGVLYIYAFMPIDHVSSPWKGDTPACLYYDERDMEGQEDEALDENLQLLGSIHSHPDNIDCIFSEQDLRTVQGAIDCVMGICAITRQVSKGRTRSVCEVQYWPCPQPIEVVYGPSKGKKS